jgi:hypothetical protein
MEKNRSTPKGNSCHGARRIHTASGNVMSRRTHRAPREGTPPTRSSTARLARLKAPQQLVRIRLRRLGIKLTPASEPGTPRGLAHEPCHAKHDGKHLTLARIPRNKPWVGRPMNRTQETSRERRRGSKRQFPRELESLASVSGCRSIANFPMPYCCTRLRPGRAATHRKKPDD